MVVMSAIWLVGLVPLLAAGVWLFWGRRERVGVPFLRLWRGAEAGKKTRPGIQPPPVAIVLALAGAVLAVLAAAHLEIGSRGRAAVRLVIDRGMSMSARGHHDLRFREATADLAEALKARFSDCSIDLTSVPGGPAERVDLSRLVPAVEAMGPTTMDTRQALEAAVMQQLDEGAGPMAVISDARLAGGKSRVIQVSPQARIHDVGIIQLAARQRPVAEVMVRIRNQSGPARADLVVSSAGRQVHRRLDLPANGQARDYFVRVPEIGSMVSAALKVRDDQDADKCAWLVREGSSPRIECRSALPPELQRMIAVYQRARPASGGSSRVLVVKDVSQLPGEAPVVVLQSAQHTLAGGRVLAALHPVTSHVNWERLPRPVHAADAPPAGWTPLVWLGTHVLVATRSQPMRQIWIGFDAPRWAATADYVIFWTNVFDWTGGGGEALAGHSIDEWDPQWKAVDASPDGPRPGIYRRSDGAWRAFNPPNEPAGAPVPARVQWRGRLASFALRRGGMDLAGPLLAAAIGCLLLAAATWPGRGPAGIRNH